MIEDLDLLASRIRQLTELTQSLRTENATLCKSLAQRDSHIRMLRETVSTAQLRVDAVLARLPGAPEENEEDELDPDNENAASPGASAGGDTPTSATGATEGSAPGADSAEPGSTESASAPTGARSLYGTS